MLLLIDFSIEGSHQKTQEWPVVPRLGETIDFPTANGVENFKVVEVNYQAYDSASFKIGVRLKRTSDPSATITL